MSEFPDNNGWSDVRRYTYLTSPDERRDVAVNAQRCGDAWTILIYDMARALREERARDIELIYRNLTAKTFTGETFVGRRARKLDAQRIGALTAFIERARQAFRVPGVSIGLVQDGQVVYEGGFGIRDVRGTARPKTETLYPIASNTRMLTTLMLAKLVDEGKLTWDTPVTTLLPSFRLGDAWTTDRMLVRHLICACVGVSGEDDRWLFQYRGLTAEGVLGKLATLTPTSGFSEIFQDSNALAAAAGFAGARWPSPGWSLARRMTTRCARGCSVRSA